MAIIAMAKARRQGGSRSEGSMAASGGSLLLAAPKEEQGCQTGARLRQLLQLRLRLLRVAPRGGVAWDGGARKGVRGADSGQGACA